MYRPLHLGQFSYVSLQEDLFEEMRRLQEIQAALHVRGGPVPPLPGVAALGDGGAGPLPAAAEDEATSTVGQQALSQSQREEEGRAHPEGQEAPPSDVAVPITVAP